MGYWGDEVEISVLLHIINLYHWDDIYFLVLASNLVNYMIVEARLKNDEIESASINKTWVMTAEESGGIVSDHEDSDDQTDEQQEEVNLLDRMFR